MNKLNMNKLNMKRVPINGTEIPSGVKDLIVAFLDICGGHTRTNIISTLATLLDNVYEYNKSSTENLTGIQSIVEQVQLYDHLTELFGKRANSIRKTIMDDVIDGIRGSGAHQYTKEDLALLMRSTGADEDRIQAVLKYLAQLEKGHFDKPGCDSCEDSKSCVDSESVPKDETIQ